ncbi:S-adenosyl-L-methionine-dependent methyltransferase [Syncephalis plumigaleata]|nr:S-adenosyl-L-methionine-dependent methyltransferase [Syncephalis plumigaleata]
MSVSKEEQASIEALPAALREFARQNDIDERNFITNLTDKLLTTLRPRTFQRYIRILYQWQPTISRERLAQDLDIDIEDIQPVEGMTGFYALPPTIHLAHGSQFYKEGKLFGMDITSAIAVHALSLEQGDQVLDLCCAPGAKMCLIADHLSLLETTTTTTETTSDKAFGTVTGVDISRTRMATARALLRKYSPTGLPNARLFVMDGRTFNVHAPIRLGPYATPGAILMHQLEEEEGINNKDIQKQEVIKPFYAPKTLRSDPQYQHPCLLYTKVLVDAECTHDGSIAHVRKHEQQGWIDLEKAFLASDRVAVIDQLQQSLLEQGWRLLAPGGILVYATCSLSIQQNEAVIAWFLNEGSGANGRAYLEPTMNPTGIPSVPARPVPGLSSEQLTCLLRFEPWYCGTSGLFIARLRKPEIQNYT